MCSHTIDGLADEITELASHIHAATCRWLGLVAEFERRGGSADWGARSCAHWLSWRCSLGPVAAREHVRVALRLEELPLIRAAFAEGRLSYSQVRALTRVEKVVAEEELLSLARHATAAEASPVESPAVERASAEAPSLGERRADALVLMADTLLAGEPAGRRGDRHQGVVRVDVAALRDAEGETELADGSPIAAETARRLACDA